MLGVIVATMHAVCLAVIMGSLGPRTLAVDRPSLEVDDMVALFPDWDEERFPLYALTLSSPIPRTEDARVS